MKLFYRKYGSGPPLIILHGLFGSSDNWVSFAKSISDTYTVYLPDLRNHGQSPHSPVHNYESMAGDVKELADSAGLGKFFLAGHSMGGKTAIRFASNNPERLSGLLIADISPFRHTGNTETEFSLHLSILDFMRSADMSEIKSRLDAEILLKQRTESEKVRELVLKNLKRESDNSFSWKINYNALYNNIDCIADDAVAETAGQTEISGFPVFFLKGEYSDYITGNDIRKISLMFPGAEFITINGAGHWMHADNPDLVRKCFLKLLDISRSELRH